MQRASQQWLIIAPLVLGSCLARADGSLIHAPGADPFNFDPAELDPIQFSRVEEESSELGARAGIDRPLDVEAFTRQTEFAFKIKPRMPDFSRAGAYGLNLFDAPRLDVQSTFIGVDGLNPNVGLLRDGFEYSAGIRLEHEDASIDGTAYVSSSLLGLSYGRLGRLWYGAIDVNLEQFDNERTGAEASEILSLDVTTGRRFGITGLDANSPLWMLSVQGNLDMNEWENNDDLEASSHWFINPSLFWQQPGFMFSAQMQLPMQFETLDDEGEPDYRLRAVFEKQFK